MSRSLEDKEIAVNEGDERALLMLLTSTITEIDRYLYEEAEQNEDTEYLFDVLDHLADGVLLIAKAKQNGEH